MHKSLRSTQPEFEIISERICAYTWASSDGAPGRNFGEHNGVSSIFGTMYPYSGSIAFGCANSYIKF